MSIVEVIVGRRSSEGGQGSFKTGSENPVGCLGLFGALNLVGSSRAK